MQISFKSAKMKKIFEGGHLLKKEYGEKCAKKIMLRMAVLKAAKNLNSVPQCKPDRCHGLKGQRKGQYAVDLLHPFRLVFQAETEDLPVDENGEIDLKQITSIKILKVEDYH